MNKRQFVAQTSAKEFNLMERAIGVALNTESFDRAEKRQLKVIQKRAQEVNALPSKHERKLSY